MTHSSLILYVKDNAGSYHHQDTLIGSVLKCEMLFDQVVAESRLSDMFCYRLDLLNNNDEVVCRKLFTDELPVSQISMIM